MSAQRFDVVVLGATPGGIAAAIAAARQGCSVALLDRWPHIGGLPANGLGATDIHTRGATGGLFTEFTRRIHAHYAQAYGPHSPQVDHCSNGYHFEPRVAEVVLEGMLDEQPAIQVLRHRQFDALAQRVTVEDGRLARMAVRNLQSGELEEYAAAVFVDATYEGDLAAAAGAPFRLGREGFNDHREPNAGRVYLRWSGPADSGAIFEEANRVRLRYDGGVPGPGSTLEADHAIQAYNYRVCLTDAPDNRIPIPKPANYDRGEFASLVEDVRSGHVVGFLNDYWLDAGVVNPCRLPNGKTDSNNHHSAFISTDLPEENWPWPTADWAWRDQFAQRLRDYTLGLLWFAQHDTELPQWFRRDAQRWGLAKDEYTDNGCFPRQVYVREGRRVEGEYLFTAHDAIPTGPGLRPPIHADSITASHYSIDSHACRKREPGRIGLDGFMSYPTEPYTVPYGVIVPKAVDGLLTPVPVSATHLGYGTLRMEPCWMALGEAAGIAAALSVRHGQAVRRIDVGQLQHMLVRDGAVLLYFRDLDPSHPRFAAAQYFGLRGALPQWHARLDEPVSPADARQWCALAGVPQPDDCRPGVTTRGELLQHLYDAVHHPPGATVQTKPRPARRRAVVERV